MRGKDRGTVYVSLLTVAALSLLAGLGGADAPTSTDDAGADDLFDALEAHPWASEGDELAARTHGPLPASLHQGLGALVDAHQRALITGEQAPLVAAGEDQTARLAAGAEALAATEPTPALPAGEPVHTDASLADSLMELYEAIGLGDATLAKLEPRVATATDRLPADDRRTLAHLVAAQARYQADALATAQGFSADGKPAAEDVQAMQASLADLHATAEALAADGSPLETEREETWTDPLGLVVLGTSGPDRFDADLDGDPAAQLAADQEHELRRTLTGHEAGRAETVASIGLAAGVVTTGDAQPRAGSGWHMTVLDPGGDDTYANNAAGIDAGTTIQVTADGHGPVETVRQPLVDDGRICLPNTSTCEPFGAAGFLQALGTVAVQVDADPALAAPMSSVVLDAAGDDDYKPREGPIQGAARGPAAGILHDRAGDDTYTARSLAQGASAAYGHGTLVDHAGDDTYLADARSQASAQLPSLAARPAELGPFEGEDLGLHLLQHARALLVDHAGTDGYEADELATTQGVTELDGDLTHRLRSWVPAALVDAGGPELLPVPDRPTPTGGEPVEPTRLTLDGDTQAHAWIKRALHAEDAGPPPHEDRRYKTAIHVDDRGPEPLDAYGLRFAGAHLDCQADDRLVCQLIDEASTPDVLVGSPPTVEDPPALSVTLTGHTTYQGSIAASTGTPHLLVDVLGDDRYEGDDDTVGYATDGGTAMIVDVRGQDTVRAGDRSLAHADGPESTALVHDIDGQLSADTGEESQAFARQLTATPYASLLDTYDPADRPEQPPLAVLDLGHGDEQGPAELAAGNRSQAYSQGLGTAILNGTTGPDTYEADGWGQGVHEDQQIVERFCDDERTRRTVADGLTRGLTPWAGGIGALVDPGGDDTYTIHADAGQGDAATASPHCGESAFTNILHGPVHASQPGLGLLLDADGDDRYEQTADERPAKLPSRACQDQACQPADERAWTTIDEEPVTQAIPIGTFRTIGTVGLGVDEPANADQAAFAVCQGYQPYRDGYGIVTGLLPPLAETVASLDCTGMLERGAEELPVAGPAFTASLPTADEPLTIATDTDRGDHR